jgi:hypothetical protein
MRSFSRSTRLRVEISPNAGCLYPRMKTGESLSDARLMANSAASCGSPGPLAPAQVTPANAASVATIADGIARSMPTARN